jgi:osmotically-inducible protein OsmY
MRFVAVIVGLLVAGPAGAQSLIDMIPGKTLVDRAIEARSAGDIATDNRIVLEVNRVMAELGTIKASTEIYEQRLVVTGIFDDRAVYEKFERGVRAVRGVKQLHWHVAHLSKAEQDKRKDLLDWGEALKLGTTAHGRLVGARGVADVNYRLTVDAFGTAYLIGRARSAEEKNRALAAIRATQGVRKAVDYVAVRP